MTRRSTVFTMTEEQLAELPEDQRQRAVEMQQQAEAEAEEHVARIKQIEDEQQRRRYGFALMHQLLHSYERVRDTLDEIVYEDVTKHDVGKRSDVTQQIAEDGFISPSRVRQIVAQQSGEGKQSETRRRNAETLTRSFLVREYVVKGRTTVDIGNELDVHQQTVANHLKKHGIPLRKRGRATADSASGGE